MNSIHFLSTAPAVEGIALAPLTAAAISSAVDTSVAALTPFPTDIVLRSVAEAPPPSTCPPSPPSNMLSNNIELVASQVDLEAQGGIDVALYREGAVEVHLLTYPPACFTV
ncbi:hypothetical protein DL93DRAFT_2074946 [Clavulina sp. PMI_390]|nr:hypothetical protein DL93DRAFT_2074946 [Clavulina sp. PMI_390]